MRPESPHKSGIWQNALKKMAPNLMRHKKPEALPLRINWRRIFVLPTKPGIFFAVITFLMLVASLNFNNNMGLMMTFLLFGVAQVAMYRVFLNIRNLLIHHVVAKPVFLGQHAVFDIYLQADQDKFDICMDKPDASRFISELQKGDIKYISTQQITRKRGWQRCEKIKIYSSYPFGLFYAWIWAKPDVQCLVYPRPEDSAPPLPLDLYSEGQTEKIIHGDDFHGLKPFQSGDSLRLIAWKRTAQTGELISRELQQYQGEKLVLNYANVPLADVEKKLSRLTAWVVEAQQMQLDYCLILPGFNSGFGYSGKHYLNCLKALALFGEGQ